MTDEITRLQARVKVLEDALRAQITGAREAALREAAALRDVADRWDCGHDVRHCNCADHIEQWRFAEDEVLALIRSTHATDPVTNAGCCQPVKVKPLEWGAYPNPVFAGPDISVANVSGAVISYYYQAGRDPDAPGYYVFAAPTHGTLQWRSTGYASIEAAKAAAQADYEARIIAALEPAPVTLAEALQVPEVRALVEALDCGINQYREMREVNSAFYDAARAALRAIRAQG